MLGCEWLNLEIADFVHFQFIHHPDKPGLRQMQCVFRTLRHIAGNLRFKALSGVFGVVAMLVRYDYTSNAGNAEIDRLLHVLERNAAFYHQAIIAIVKQVTIAL